MTNLGSSLAAIVTDRNTWQTRANNAWGSTRVWNSGTSFESAYNSEYANARDTSTSTHPPGWANNQLWSTTASQWQTQDTTDLTNYNNEVTAYNNLLNGLTDTLTTVSLVGLSWNGSGGSGSSSVYTLTIPKTGHYEIAVYARFSETDNAFGSEFTCTVGGTAGVSDSFLMTQGNNNGTHAMGYGYATHGTYSAGQTVTFQVSHSAWNLGSIPSIGSINAHWVPTTANPS